MLHILVTLKKRFDKDKRNWGYILAPTTLFGIFVTLLNNNFAMSQDKIYLCTYYDR